MSLQIGIVGLPNVGKSTLFKALTKKQVDAANYPFCTIDPNVGVVSVPDPRLDQLAALEHSKKVTPAVIEFVDIAGLVRGAHKGEGLGNKFLTNIREVDAIIHVVRIFHDDNVIHVEQSVDPLRDIETITTELILKDIETIEKLIHNEQKAAKGGSKEAAGRLALMQQIAAAFNANKPATTATAHFTQDEKKSIRDVQLLTDKPVLYVFNVAESELASPTLPPELAALPHVTISAQIESELAELSKEEAVTYMADLGITESGLDRLIKEGYKLLNLITYFTQGPDETKAWTITRDTKAPQAAGVIHTDFERGFIAADVVNWHDLVTATSWAKAKEKGLLRGEGKEYIVQDGDVMVFKFNV